MAKKAKKLTPHEMIRKIRSGRKSKKLHAEVGNGRKSWPIPDTGVKITIEKYDLIDGNLNVWVSATRQGQDFMSDDHLIYINPPLLVSGVENVRGALEIIITQTVMGHISHKL